MLIGSLLIRLISFQDAVAIMVETRNQTCSWSLRYFDESHCWLIQQLIHLIKDIPSGEKLFKVNSKVKKTTTIDFSPKSKLLFRVSLFWWPNKTHSFRKCMITYMTCVSNWKLPEVKKLHWRGTMVKYFINWCNQMSGGASTYTIVAWLNHPKNLTMRYHIFVMLQDETLLRSTSTFKLNLIEQHHINRGRWLIYRDLVSFLL